jgi:hypothetical protein
VRAAVAKLSTRFYSSLTKMVKKYMNNFVVKVWKKFDLDTDLELDPCHTMQFQKT